MTTIIVGLSLVSLRAIPDLADDMTAWIENLLGVGGGRAQFGLLLCVIGAVGAFVVSYIWTTINFRHTLEGGELDIRESWQPVVDHLATEVAARAVSDAEVVARHSPPAASPIAGFVSVRDNRK